jgi:hypothetical protein
MRCSQVFLRNRTVDTIETFAVVTDVNIDPKKLQHELWNELDYYSASTSIDVSHGRNDARKYYVIQFGIMTNAGNPLTQKLIIDAIQKIEKGIKSAIRQRNLLEMIEE